MTASHDHSHATQGRRLAMALVLVLATAVLELVGGLLTHSLALLADFGHVASDVAALALALFAVRVSARPHTMQWTFGFHRAEVIAAAINGLSLLAIAAFIAFEAVQRLRHPEPYVGALGLILVATAGLIANLVTAWLLGHGGHSHEAQSHEAQSHEAQSHEAESLNMRAARLHVLMDILGSVIAIVAGLVIAPTGWTVVDPLLSLASVVLLVIGAVRLLKGALGVLMDAVPPDIDLDAIARGLRGIAGIVAVHDIHCWSIDTGVAAFAAHIEVAPGHNPQYAVQRATEVLRTRYGIDHVTLQPEVVPVHRPAEPFIPEIDGDEESPRPRVRGR